MIQKSGAKDDIEYMIDLYEYLLLLNMAFSELKKLTQIALNLPLSTAGVERTFSKLKIIKSYLRTSMANRRLSNLAIVSFHRKRALNIDLECVIDRFIEKYPNCRIILV